MSLSISNAGLELIKKFEGCKLTAYQDSVGVWTIGYGHTSGVKSGQTITQAQADAYLKTDCASAENTVNSYNSKYNWNQNQFDALVSFTFNCGSGNLKLLTASGTRTVAEISTKITAYNKACGKVLQGLTNRRTAEKELFDKAVANTYTSIASTKDSSSVSTFTTFVKSVQSSIGAKVDGIPGNETLSNTVTVSKFKNNRHTVVKPLQTYLNSLNYNCGSVDGIAGTKFDTAVKEFQKANGCVVDGEITAKAKTWKKLLKLA